MGNKKTKVMNTSAIHSFMALDNFSRDICIPITMVASWYGKMIVEKPKTCVIKTDFRGKPL